MESSRSILVVALGTVGALGSLAAGSLWRDQVEKGAGATTNAVTAATIVPTQGSGLVASLEGNVNGKEADLFYQVQEVLEQNFVDGVKEPNKLASGAIRGMISHLSDPYAMFMDDKQFKAYQGVDAGNWEGIGAELRLKYNDAALEKYRRVRQKFVDERRAGRSPKLSEELDAASLLPEVRIVAVLPNSPAERAGLEPGDIITRINDQWVWSGPSNKVLDKLRDELMNPKTTEARATEIRKEFEDRVDKSIMPGRALDKLTVGKEGTLTLTWTTPEGKTQTSMVTRAETRLDPNALSGPPTPVTFMQGSAEAIQRAIQGQQEIKLDLRNVPSGSMERVREVLAVLLPNGTYGVNRNPGQKKEVPFAVQGTGDPSWRFEIYTDSETRGHAAILVNALLSTGRATVVGPKPPTTAPIEELIALPDGSGYLLPIGIYAQEAAK